MLDVAPTELLLVAVVALVVIGPKDLPKAMRVVGQWVGRARGMARHFRSGIDEMIRHSELEEMEKKWREENERIMREFPTVADPVMLPDASAGAAVTAVAATPALAGPDSPADGHSAGAEADPDGDAEHAAAYVAPEMVSPSDFTNWHGDDRVIPDAPVEAPSEPAARSESDQANDVVQPGPPPAAPEEQLSLLPPEPGAHRRPGKPLP